MSYSKICLSACILITSVVVAAGLYSQPVITNNVPSAVSQDFLVLQAAARESAGASVVNVETLREWQFTARERPLKCRFVNPG